MSSFFLRTILLIVITPLIASCRPIETNAKLRSSQSESSVSCPIQSFSTGGNRWVLGRMLGHGASGRVHVIVNSEGIESDDMVAKVIHDNSEAALWEQMNEEVFLAKTYPGFYIETKVAATRHIVNNAGQEAFIGILLKKRIHGETLMDLMTSPNSSYLDTNDKIVNAFLSLERFKTNLAALMEKQSYLEQNIFLGDLHGANIMYDGTSWYIVDGMKIDSRQAFGFYLCDPPLGTGCDFSSFSKISHLPEILDADFFVNAINNQLKEDYQEIYNLYHKVIEQD